MVATDTTGSQADTPRRSPEGSLDDRLLPHYDVVKRHEARVHATAEATFGALTRVDMSRSRVVRTLFFLRGMSRGPFTLDRIERSGFVRLVDEPPRHLAFGLIGKFWTPTGHLQRFEPGAFVPFAAAGYAKALWTFTVTSLGDGASRLETETRVHCLDDVSQRRFLRYWTVVGPFSSWTRREILRLVVTSAESGHAS